MKYIAKLGGYFDIQPFSEIPLKLNHKENLPGIVTYADYNTAYIYTELEYEVGQKVSIGGFEIGNRKFKMIELSITDFPALVDAEIIEKVEI